MASHKRKAGETDLEAFTKSVSDIVQPLYDTSEEVQEKLKEYLGTEIMEEVLKTVQEVSAKIQKLENAVEAIQNSNTAVVKAVASIQQASAQSAANSNNNNNNNAGSPQKLSEAEWVSTIFL